jgi:hypothetical protein
MKKVKSMPGRWKTLLEKLEWALVGDCRYWKRCPYFHRDNIPPNKRGLTKVVLYYVLGLLLTATGVALL